LFFRHFFSNQLSTMRYWFVSIWVDAANTNSEGIGRQNIITVSKRRSERNRRVTYELPRVSFPTFCPATLTYFPFLSYVWFFFTTTSTFSSVAIYLYIPRRYITSLVILSAIIKFWYRTAPWIGNLSTRPTVFPDSRLEYNMTRFSFSFIFNDNKRAHSWVCCYIRSATGRLLQHLPVVDEWNARVRTWPTMIYKYVLLYQRHVVAPPDSADPDTLL